MSNNTSTKLMTLFLSASMFVIILAVPIRDAEAHHGLSFSVSGQIVVVPAPPPVVVMPLPPPPPMVVVQATPLYLAPPPVIVTPTPVVVAQPQLQPAKIVSPGAPVFHRQVGLGLSLLGAIHSNESKWGEGMGGAGLMLRMKLAPHFALELGVDALGGKGFAGEERLEIPVTLSTLWYPNRHWSHFQPYFVLGFGGTWARAGEDPHADRPVYLGGLAGLGLELKWNHFAIYGDLRGFIRHRMNERSPDPMAPTGGSCKENGECTDWEGGGLISFGIILYF